jgi:hypothetical protein
LEPEHQKLSNHAQLTNYYYQQLLLNNQKNHLPLQSALTGDAQLKELVTKFAEDRNAYNTALGNAFLKLVNLGTEQNELVSVERLLEDHPLHHFINRDY